MGTYVLSTLRLVITIHLLISPTYSQEPQSESEEESGEEGGGYCMGGPDPTCYFPQEPTPFEQDEDSIRRKRSDSLSAKPALVPIPKDEEDEDELNVRPLDNQKDMSDVHLKQYEPDTVINSYYPPWSYQGFYSPRDWDEIPTHYFAPKKVRKSTKMSKMLEDAHEKEESGRSFMEFGEAGIVSNCSSDFPSPIDILSDKARVEPSFIEFNIMHYDVHYGFMIFLPEDGTDLLFLKLQTPLKQISKKPSIDKGSVLGSPLTLDRILIHFGTDPNLGSEHRIDGQSFGMELQFMFTLQTQGKELTYYDVLYEYAVSKDSSLFGKNMLALCIFVQVAPTFEKTPPSGKAYNKGMSYLAMAAQEFAGVRNREKFRAFQVKKKVLTLQDFFEVPFEGHYYTYFGSLTHPPCFNNTRYSVFEKPIYISHNTWRDFQFLPSEYSDSGFMADNFRPLELIKVWNNYSSKDNPEVLPYLTPEVREKISYTVAKSRFSTSADRLIEYDYTDDDNFKTNSASSPRPCLRPLVLFYLFSEAVRYGKTASTPFLN